MSLISNQTLPGLVKAFFISPAFVFALAAFAFVVTQSKWNVISLNYTAVHFYWGLFGTLIAGYWPFRFNFINLFRKGGGGLADNFDSTFKWSFLTGVTFIISTSIINEVFNDPKENGIPFLNAWHHLAADMAGLALFSLIYLWFKYRQP